MSLSPAFLDELRARTSLSALIGRKVRLVKANREMKGCCPFHGEKTPSFYVNDDKGFYHCFGCSAHGDAIGWMTNHEGMQFIDAVKELAAAAGLEMPARDSRHDEQDRQRENMLAVMDRAQRFFNDMWRGSHPPDVRGRDAAVAYLASREVDIRAIDQFGIGYAPRTRRGEPSALQRHLHDVNPASLIALGLMKEGEDGAIFDFFRGRIMFPIHDARGRVIGFGGRALGKGEPKYLNSPDTPVFDKGRTLYNHHRAAPAARASKRLVVVEGYMDVIGLAFAGVDDAVAPNGTALTEDQIARLWKLADAPILCFDGDAPGHAAAARAAIRALPLLEPDRSLAFVTPAGGQDPDDVARRGGSAAVGEMLASPKPLVDLLWEHEVAASPLVTPEQRAGLGQRLRDHAASIRNRDVARAYLDDFRARYEARFAAAGPRRAPHHPNPAAERRPFSRTVPQTMASKAIAKRGLSAVIEGAIIAGLLRFPDLASEEMETVALATFSDERMTAIRDAILDGRVPDPDAVSWCEASARKLGFSFNNPADPVRGREDLIETLSRLRP